MTKTNPGLTQVNVGIGWESPAALELDTSAFLLGSGGKVSSDEDLIFYNNPTTPFITYSDGQQSGDKKQFALDLTRIPANIEKIAFTLTIYDADQKRQNFGQVQGGFIRFAHPVSGEVLRFNLDSGFTVETVPLSLVNCIVITGNGNSTRLAQVFPVDWMRCALILGLKWKIIRLRRQCLHHLQLLSQYQHRRQHLLLRSQSHLQHR